MILLDTHTLIWLADDDNRLGKQSKEKIEPAFAADELYVSAISFWEVAMLCQKQRLTLPYPVRQWRSSLLDLGLGEIPVTGEISILSVELEEFHADPADRLIVATALHHHATLITADRLILNWIGQVARFNAKI